MKYLLFQATCSLYLLLMLTQETNAQQKDEELNQNPCSKSSTTREYFVKQGQFQTKEELIPPGCFAQLMTELNGDDSVAAVFLSRTKMRGCIDANYPYQVGTKKKLTIKLCQKWRMKLSRSGYARV